MVSTCGYSTRDSSFEGVKWLRALGFQSDVSIEKFLGGVFCVPWLCFLPEISCTIVSQRNLVVSACALAVCMSPFRVWLLRLLSWMDDATPLPSLYQAAECVRVCLLEQETQRGGCR